MSKHTTKPTLTDVELEDRKREIAHQIWIKEGKPEGLAEQHWEKACLVVMTMAEEPGVNPSKWLKPKAELVAMIESPAQPKAINTTALPVGDNRKHPAHRSAS